ncbi:MAG: phosphocholine cytidylyltransferase family protein [Chloroflexi bacterium]|nr:phosphocholine cytidylyltransferase family protein [Chloroflexota bacterium]
MGKYTENLPKGMLRFGSKTLVQHQIDVLRTAGIEEIVIVTGYRSDTIKYPAVKYCHNPNYAETNMVESLMCAREEMDGDLLVAYSDVLYTPKLAKRMVEQPADISVAVDPEWREYWLARYGTTETDLETLTIRGRFVVDLGVPANSSAGIDHRYVGLIRFSTAGLDKALTLYDSKKASGESWTKSGNEFQKGYMTDFLGELIQAGAKVTPVMAAKQWLEFDTEQDYELILKHLQTGTLTTFFELGEILV